MEPSGRCAFYCFEKCVFGYVEDGDWVDGSPQVVLFLKENIFGVFKVLKTRSGIKCLVGKTFGSGGLIATGLFEGTSLKSACEVENNASGFMGI